MYAAWKDRNYVYMALEWAPGVSVGVACERCITDLELNALR